MICRRQSLGKGSNTMVELHPPGTESRCSWVVQKAESCKEEHLGCLEGVWGTLERMEMGDTLKQWVEGEALRTVLYMDLHNQAAADFHNRLVERDNEGVHSCGLHGIRKAGYP